MCVYVVHMYIYKYMYIRTFINVYTHTHTHNRTHTHMYMYENICIHVYIYTCMYVHTPPSCATKPYAGAMATLACSFFFMLTCMRTHTYTRMSMSTHLVCASDSMRVCQRLDARMLLLLHRSPARPQAPRPSLQSRR